MNRKLGINTDCLCGALDEISALTLAHDIGFEAITTSATSIDDISKLKNASCALGIDFPYIHSPFANINSMWTEGDGFHTVYNGIIQSIDSASACNIGAVVVHVSSGWLPPPVNDLGLSRFDSLVEHAADHKVTLAFENLRVLGNLAYLTDRYEDFSNVRFCYDCGHEHCYTKTVNWIDIFKNRIAATHIHDNPGRDLEDKVSDNDKHWLPFDGTFNYHAMMEKLDKYGYSGPLMLEVSKNAKAEYKALSVEEFMSNAFERIKRISELNKL